ncbi:MAG: SpoIIE family protein phosphatase [Leptospiraceae bacterium]|nr:SpoIIE family protein phosphatase [Leptospiraceae bacterium]MDW8307043.1 SpoIIE family protein phosphatase [Leptospiraceae bacterium]
MYHSLYVAVISHIFLVSSLLAQRNSFAIEEIELGGKIRKWESSTKHTWWFTAQEIDPLVFSQELIEKEKAKIKAKKPTGIDEPPPGWIPVSIPANLTKAGILPWNLKRGWFLRSFYWNEYSEKSAMVRLGVISDRDKVYLNGVLIGESGNFGEELPQSYDKLRLYELPSRLLRQGQLNVLLVHCEAYFDHEIGPVSDTIEIGPAELMVRQKWLTMLNQLLLLAGYVIVGLYFLFLYVRRPQEKANLAFGLFALSLVLYQFLRTQLKYELGLPFYPMKKTEYLVLQWVVPLFYAFVRFYFPPPRNLFFRILDYSIAIPLLAFATVFVTVLFTQDVRLWNQINDQLTLNLGFPWVILTSVIQISYQLYRKNLDAWIMLAGVLVMIAAAILDILSNRQIINIPRVAGYAFFLFITTLAFILANNFVRLHKQVEDLNKNLEKKVEERTRELHESLQRIKELKEQQDGDYFLTSLLIDALMYNKAKSENLRIESLIYQKKEFTFKKWTKRIGGDFCVADSLTLRGRPVTVFVNADAMGKSMQGAGGVLVLGSVLAAIFESTRHSPEKSALYPEEWLRDAFAELQRIFESFNGSMMVSAVIGVIDDRTGNLFLMNAEHPFTVLYRDGVASFIEEEMMLRKIGTVGIRGQLKIVTLKLYPRDIIICGSDGRDDLAIGIDKEGNRIINENYELFLRHVEKAKGDLKELKKILEESGEITDDLSLLRIEYKEQGPLPDISYANREEFLAALRQAAEKDLGLIEDIIAAGFSHERAYIEDCERLCRSYLRQKKWRQAVALAEAGLLYDPQNNQFIYLASFARKLLGDFDRAIQLAQLLYLRNPTEVRNLINLADLYLATQRPHLAEKYIAEAKERDPENEKVRRLEHIYQKRVAKNTSFS